MRRPANLLDYSFSVVVRRMLGRSHNYSHTKAPHSTINGSLIRFLIFRKSSNRAVRWTDSVLIVHHQRANLIMADHQLKYQVDNCSLSKILHFIQSLTICPLLRITALMNQMEWSRDTISDWRKQGGILRFNVKLFLVKKRDLKVDCDQNSSEIAPLDYHRSYWKNLPGAAETQIQRGTSIMAKHLICLLISVHCRHKIDATNLRAICVAN